MPSDTYILTISEAGVSVPSTHASTHLTGGSDAIPVASTSTSGLMSPTIFDQHVVNTAKVSNATHTGDVTDASGVLTVNKIKGIDLSTFSNNSILKTTTGGIIAPAVAGDFPILNQSTIGNANTATFATTAGSATSATTATTATSATSATTATNIAGGSIGSVPYQLASGTTSLLSAGTSGYVLTANGTSSAPSWSPINLSADVGGILPVGKGGTGLTTITGYVKGTGTSALSTSPTVPVADISGTLPVGSGGTGLTSITGYVKGTGTAALSTSSTIPVADILGTIPVARGGTGAETLTGYVKGMGTDSMTAVATIPATDGGTGQISYAVGDLLYANTTTSIAKLADVATGNVLLSGGLNVAPSYGKVSLEGAAKHVTGFLGFENGGIGTSGMDGFSGFIQTDGSGNGSVVTVLTPDYGGTGLINPTAFNILATTGGSDPYTQLPTGTVGQTLTSEGSSAFPTWRSRYHGLVYLTGGSGTQSLSTTFVQLSGTATTFDSAVSSGFSNGNTNYILTYTGTQTTVFRVEANVDLTTATANDTISIRIAKNSTSIVGSEIRGFTGASTTTESHLVSLTTSYLVSLAQNDTVSIYVAAATGTLTSTARRMQLIATQV